MDMFEQASRLKIRFSTTKGALAVEDLWELPLTSRTTNANLDDIARHINRALKDEGEEISFVDPSTPRDSKLTLAFNIVKRVIEVRKQERDAAAARAKSAEKRQAILAIIAHKEGEALSNTSMEDLRKMLEEV